MLNVLMTLINRLETLSAMKIEAMEGIAKRNGLGEELEKLILLDNNIYDTIQQAKTIIGALANEPL
jgi:hypothetical protein